MKMPPFPSDPIFHVIITLTSLCHMLCLYKVCSATRFLPQISLSSDVRHFSSHGGFGEIPYHPLCVSSAHLSRSGATFSYGLHTCPFEPRSELGW